MSKLILVRHSLPEIVPTSPARQWVLSEEGRRRCQTMADQLAVFRPDVFVTSVEPKAIETGQIVAERLGRPCETGEGLHEHERRNESFGTKEGFEASVADFFARPEQLVFGSETADQAHDRFSRAVASLIERHPGQNLAVVAHGTVMTLFVTRAVDLEPFFFWKRLGLPAFVVMSLPELELLEVVAEV